MSRIRTIISLLAVSLTTASALPAAGPLIIHGITADTDHVVFATAGQLWRVPRTGGDAEAVTTGSEDTFPHLSPDGAWLAFTRHNDVYVMPAEGGEAVRRTWNPKTDRVRGWTPDSRSILFATGRDGDGQTRLYTIERDGVWPEPLPLPSGVFGAFSPDRRRVAYSPWDYGVEFGDYRYYRGGLTAPLWVADLSSSEVQVVGEATANHRYPMWLEDTLYYVSDTTGTANLYAFDLETRKARPLTSYQRFGIRSASLAAGHDAIVFVRAGRIHRFDRAGGAVREVAVNLPTITEERNPKTVKAMDWATGVALSPTGDRILLAARGEIVVGSPTDAVYENLTETSDAAERSPALSPDGTTLAYFSDRDGAYALHLRDLGGEQGETVLEVEERPSFYRETTFSPDGRHIAFSGQRLGLFLADREDERVRRIDHSSYLAQQRWLPSWSPDGRYLTYAKGQPNHTRAIYIYDTETETRHRVSPELLDASWPVFDRNGKYLHFVGSHVASMAAATDIWGLLSADLMAPNVVRRVFTVVLQAGAPGPLLPIVAEPHPAANAGETWDASKPLEVDFAAITDRVVQLPLRARPYDGLAAGPAGTLLLRSTAWPGVPGARRGLTRPLYRYRITDHDFTELAEHTNDLAVAADGSTLLIRTGDSWTRMPVAGDDPSARAESLDLSAIQFDVEPAQEWQQMFHEAWRMMADFFYDPGHHGQDLAALEEHFAEYLPQIQRRRDLTYLFRDMLGHVSISHMSIGGGDQPASERPRDRIGVLGGEFEIERGRYRITRVYRPKRPDANHTVITAAPLGQVGLDVPEGSYLLAVDGKELHATENLYARLAGTAGRPTRLRIGPNADGTAARDVIVVPIAGENTLKRASWLERNRARVNALSGGRLAYVAARDYSWNGIQETIGQLTAQADKEGVVIDQRYSPGGTTSDALVQLLTNTPLHNYAFPYGEDLTVPTTQIRGPKILLINQFNWSAAETFPLMFKLAGAGTIVGTRTAGAGTGGAFEYPRLIDGGRITIPNRASYDPVAGRWAENHGIEPDVEVPLWPVEWRQGLDPQLEKAVALALQQLDDAAPSSPRRPPYPVHPE